MKITDKIHRQIVFRVLVVLAWLLVAISSRGQERSNRFLIPEKYITYSGYEVSMTTQSFRLHSQISALHNLRVRQVGARVGAVASNQWGKIRPSIGLAYSDGSTPYTIDVASAEVLGNLYVLKMINRGGHFVEPYVTMGAGYQRTKFSGTYLNTDAIANYSITKEPRLGTVDAVRYRAGLGAEFRLANDTQHFIHLFTEVTAGMTENVRITNSAFNGTSAPSLRFSVGASFGLARY